MPSKRRPSILMLFPDVPAEASTGGQVRAFHFLRGLTEMADVTACIVQSENHGRLPVNIAEKCRAVLQPQATVRIGGKSPQNAVFRFLSILLRPCREHGYSLVMTATSLCVSRSETSSLGILHRLYGYLLAGIALLANRFCEIDPSGVHFRRSGIDALLPKIRETFAERSPDVIWCEHSYLYPIAGRLRQQYPTARVVVNTHNVETQLALSIAETMKSSLARLWMQVESRILRRSECRMLKEADLVYCCSEQDADRFGEMVRGITARIVVVPNGVDTKHFHKLRAESSDPVLLFAGTAGYPPNDDAVEWLVNEILPLIRNEVSDVKLVLAGRNAGSRWGKYSKEQPGVTIASDVPDMREWLGRANVCVVPLRSGSGTRLKILEAMSSGRAVVSTTLGAEGSEVEQGRHLLLADDSRSFADAVVTLLRDEGKRQLLADNGRFLVEQQYDWTPLIATAQGELEVLLASQDINSVRTPGTV